MRGLRRRGCHLFALDNSGNRADVDTVSCQACAHAAVHVPSLSALVWHTMRPLVMLNKLPHTWSMRCGDTAKALMLARHSQCATHLDRMASRRRSMVASSSCTGADRDLPLPLPMPPFACAVHGRDAAYAVQSHGPLSWTMASNGTPTSDGMTCRVPGRLSTSPAPLRA